MGSCNSKDLVLRSEFGLLFFGRHEWHYHISCLLRSLTFKLTRHGPRLRDRSFGCQSGGSLPSGKDPVGLHDNSKMTLIF